ncbi:hypothetical protein M2140_001773 [Clostridiales Family XIII bacterium PM5-7]
MKSYYQPKRIGYRLPPPVYAKTVKFIQCYDFYVGLANVDERRSLTALNVEKVAVEKAQAEKYIELIEAALDNCVPAEHKDKVFGFVAREMTYAHLTEYDEEADIPKNEMKKWVQRFIWTVARELGEDYGYTEK